MLKNVRLIKKMIRSFPYSEYLFVFLPLFAYFFSIKLISDPWTLTLIIPFILAIASGFLFNTICDSQFDSAQKNPITAGLISIKNAHFLLYFFLTSSLIVFIFLYKSILCTFLFLCYIFLWFAYSGLQIRFKENILGPIVASIVLWVGGPAIFVISQGYIDAVVINLLLSYFFFYIGNELNHQIGDYHEDKEANVNTFTVRLGLKKSIITRYSMYIIGCVFLVQSASQIINMDLFLKTVILFLMVLLIGILDILIYLPEISIPLTKSTSQQPAFSSKREERLFQFSSFAIIKFFILVYTCVILNFTVWIAIFFGWVFFTNKRT
jgi:4-hydroxybenzoate polyprenyltransferase